MAERSNSDLGRLTGKVSGAHTHTPHTHTHTHTHHTNTHTHTPHTHTHHTHIHTHTHTPHTPTHTPHTHTLTHHTHPHTHHTYTHTHTPHTHHTHTYRHFLTNCQFLLPVNTNVYQSELHKRTSAQSIYSRVRLHVSTRCQSSSGHYNLITRCFVHFGIP